MHLDSSLPRKMEHALRTVNSSRVQYYSRTSNQHTPERLPHAMIYSGFVSQFPFNSSCLDKIRECLSTSSTTPFIPNFSASSFICFPSSAQLSEMIYGSSRSSLLNFNCMKLGSRDALGNSFVSTFIVCRAFGGRKDKNRRAVFALGRNGLKVVDTSVMNLVIISN
jgi:hypothetical protein